MKPRPPLSPLLYCICSALLFPISWKSKLRAATEDQTAPSYWQGWIQVQTGSQRWASSEANSESSLRRLAFSVMKHFILWKTPTQQLSCGAGTYLHCSHYEHKERKGHAYNSHSQEISSETISLELTSSLTYEHSPASYPSLTFGLHLPLDSIASLWLPITLSSDTGKSSEAPVRSYFLAIQPYCRFAQWEIEATIPIPSYRLPEPPSLQRFYMLSFPYPLFPKLEVHYQFPWLHGLRIGVAAQQHHLQGKITLFFLPHLMGECSVSLYDVHCDTAAKPSFQFRIGYANI